MSEHTGPTEVAVASQGQKLDRTVRTPERA